MTWAHAWTGARRIPLTERQTRPFYFPDLDMREANRAAIEAERPARPARAFVTCTPAGLSNADRIRKLEETKRRFALPMDEHEADFRVRMAAADRFLIRRVAQALASGQVA